MIRIASILFLLIAAVPAVSFANSWSARLGISEFPVDRTLLGLEVTRILDLTDNSDLGIGGIFRTDFTETLAPGLVTRFRYWVTDPVAIGAFAEVGYLYHRSTSDPNSYAYFLTGPVLGIRAKPVFFQWEPGILFFLGNRQIVPLRIFLGFFI